MNKFWKWANGLSPENQFIFLLILGGIMAIFAVLITLTIIK